MKILITGATGFVGNHVVLDAIQRGHSVRAMVRPATDVSAFPWARHAQVEIVRADLRNRDGLADLVSGSNCVIHLAAAKTGNEQEQRVATVAATENLLGAMAEAGVNQLVAVSSFSVYDFTRTSPPATLDELSPLETDAIDRDVYARMKLLQEQLIREYANRLGWKLIVLRPGMIWGKDNLLNAWMGIPAGRRFWIRIGTRAHIPLTYVENCAEAILLAAESKTAYGETFNVVDDALPTQREFARLAIGQSSTPRTVIPLSYGALKFAAELASVANKYLLGGRAKIPGLMIPSRLAARAKPMVYSNHKIKSGLGWTPRFSLAEGLDRSRNSTLSPAPAIPAPIYSNR